MRTRSGMRCSSKHVRWLPDQKQSRVAYAGMLADRGAAHRACSTAFSALTPAGFAGFSRSQQMAFLINAYNAFTIELVLTEYPKLKSIKDVGSIIGSPWKKTFYKLLGEQRNLDWIEHEQLRPRYNDPRIHTAIVCASIGCPALKPEAYTAERLDGSSKTACAASWAIARATAPVPASSR